MPSRLTTCYELGSSSIQVLFRSNRQIVRGLMGFSFGSPNAQPPTPTRTPISADIPSPVFQTPRNKGSAVENRGGWTPTFAEEYSVFHSTPGRLTGDHPSFTDFSTPRPLASPLFDRKLSSAEEIAAELSTHVHHLSPNPSLPLPPVDPSNQLASSPGAHITSFTGQNITTPKRTAKSTSDPFSAQTATPPASQSKGTRKLAPKLPSNNMQNDSQNGHFDFSQTPTHIPAGMLDFPVTSADFMNYPTSAPATGVGFANGKSFWDNDQSMGGMDMDFSHDGANMFETSGHRVANSLDWGRNNQIFQEEMNTSTTIAVPPSIPGSDKQTKQARPLAPKVDLSELLKTTPALPLFELNTPAQPQLQSPKQSEVAVNPANLWSRPAMTSPAVMAPPPQKVSSVSPTRPSSSQAQLQPYSQQIRESLRDQQEMQEYQTERNRARQRAERAARSSPVRGFARPGLQRSMSESRAKRQPGTCIFKYSRVPS